MIFQSFQWLLIFYFWKLLGQFSKFGVKGIKMIRMTKEIDLAQLVLCVSIGGPNMDFYLVLVRHVAQLHMTKQKHVRPFLKSCRQAIIKKLFYRE